MPNDKSKHNQSNDTGFLNIILALADDEKSFEGYTIAEQNGQSIIQKYPQLFAWAINQNQLHIEHNKSVVLDKQYPINYSKISKISNQGSNCEVITGKINLNTIQNTNSSFEYIDSINSKKSKKSNQSEKKQQVKPEDYIGTFFLQKFKNISSKKSKSQKTINLSEDSPNKSPENSQKSSPLKINSSRELLYKQQSPSKMKENPAKQSQHIQSQQKKYSLTKLNSLQTGDNLIKAQQSSFQQSILLNQNETHPIALKFQKQQSHHFAPGNLKLDLDGSQLSMNDDKNLASPSVQQKKENKNNFLSALLNISSIYKKPNVEEKQKNSKPSKQNQGNKIGLDNISSRDNIGAIHKSIKDKNTKQSLKRRNSNSKERITQQESEQNSNNINQEVEQEQSLNQGLRILFSLRSKLESFQSNFVIKINGNDFDDFNTIQQKLKKNDKGVKSQISQITQQFQNKIIIQLLPNTKLNKFNVNEDYSKDIENDFFCKDNPITPSFNQQEQNICSFGDAVNRENDRFLPQSKANLNSNKITNQDSYHKRRCSEPLNSHQNFEFAAGKQGEQLTDTNPSENQISNRNFTSKRASLQVSEPEKYRNITNKQTQNGSIEQAAIIQDGYNIFSSVLCDIGKKNNANKQIKPDKDLIQQEYTKQNSKKYQEDGLDIVAQIFGSIKRTPSKNQLSIKKMKINNNFAQNQPNQNRLDYEKRLSNAAQFLTQILGRINEDQTLQQEKIISFSKISESQPKSSNANTKRKSQISKSQKIKSQKNKQDQSISTNSKNIKAHKQSKVNTKSLSLNKIISEYYYFGNNYKEESENNSSKSKQMAQQNKMAEQLIELKKKVSLLQKKINSQNFQSSRKQQQFKNDFSRNLNEKKIKKNVREIADEISCGHQFKSRQQILKEKKLIKSANYQFKKEHNHSSVFASRTKDPFFSERFVNQSKQKPKRKYDQYFQKEVDIPKIPRTNSIYQESQSNNNSKGQQYFQQIIPSDVDSYLLQSNLFGLNRNDISDINQYQSLQRLLPKFPKKSDIPSFQSAKQKPFLTGKKMFLLFGIQQNQCKNIFVQKFDNALIFTIDSKKNILLKNGNLIYFGGCRTNSDGQWVRQGEGTQIAYNKYLFKGKFINGKWSGLGILQQFHHQNNKIYVGQFFNGKKSGKGKQIDELGNTYSGTWKNGKKQDYGVQILSCGQVYQGNFFEGEKSGYGLQYFKNGDSYKGQYQYDKFDGKGLYVWKNRSSYEGQFRKGKKNGKGVWKSCDNQNAEIYEGEYVNDRKNGFGIYKWPNGCYYEGHFKDDRKHGIGKTKYENGKISISQWLEDKIIKKNNTENSLDRSKSAVKWKQSPKQLQKQRQKQRNYYKRQQSRQKTPGTNSKRLANSGKDYSRSLMAFDNKKLKSSNDLSRYQIKQHPQLSTKLEISQTYKKDSMPNGQNLKRSSRYYQYF